MERMALAVGVAFVLGALVGAVGGTGAGFVDRAGDSDDFGSPGVSLSKSSVACGDPDPNSGWVHDVAVGESFAVTLDATVVHEPGRTVSANVSRRLPGSFHIDLRTDSADGEQQVENGTNGTTDDRPGCAATHLTLGTNLPTDYEEFSVSVNGRTLRTVEYDGTPADLHRLPSPINATEG